MIKTLSKKMHALFLFIFLLSTPLQAAIRVGTVFFEPPVVMSINQGFYIDIIQAVCQGMQAQCQIIPMNFNNLFSAIDNGDIDVAFGIYATGQRSKSYIFSLPFMLSRAQFLTLTSNNITNMGQLKGKKIGVVKEEEGTGILYNYLVDNYIDAFTVLKFDDLEDLITALSAQTISAGFIHAPTAQYWQQSSGGTFSLLGEPINLGEGVAAMALPKNADLIQRINQQLKTMESNGTYLNLYKTYFSN